MWPDAGEVLRGDAGRRHGAGVARPPAAVRDPARDPRRERRPGHLPRQQALQPRPRHHAPSRGSRTGSRRWSSATSRSSSTRSACSSSCSAASAASSCRPPAPRCATSSAASSTACSRASPARRSSPRRPCAGASATPCASSRATAGQQAGYLYHENGFHPDEQRRLLTQLADQADVALDNLRLLHERREHETHDPLTGLLNFRQLRERAAFELARAERHGRSVAFVMLDLDDFTAGQRDGRARGAATRSCGTGRRRSRRSCAAATWCAATAPTSSCWCCRRPPTSRPTRVLARVLGTMQQLAVETDGRADRPHGLGRRRELPGRRAHAPRSSSPRRRRRCTRPGPGARAASPSTPARRAPDAAVAARVELLVVGSLHRDLAPAARHYLDLLRAAHDRHRA